MNDEDEMIDDESEPMETMEEETPKANPFDPSRRGAATMELSAEQKRQMNFATPQDIADAKGVIRTVIRYGKEALQAYHFQTFREEIDVGVELKNGVKSRSYMKRKNHTKISPDAIREYADTFAKLANGILKANAQMAGLRDEKPDKQGKEDQTIDLQHLFETGEVRIEGAKKKKKPSREKN
jgi:hypothetical protein